MAGEKVYMSWREKLAAAQAVMEVLDKVDTKDGDREQELVDVIQVVLKLLVPVCNTKLIFERTER